MIPFKHTTQCFNPLFNAAQSNNMYSMLFVFVCLAALPIYLILHFPLCKIANFDVAKIIKCVINMNSVFLYCFVRIYFPCRACDVFFNRTI